MDFQIKEGQNIFFTSDTHFNHKNIIKYCKRPFISVEEHDETLINNWNKVIDKNDIVFHLGDFAFASKTYVNNVLDKLNGKIYLCIGNHDWRRIVKEHKDRFIEISQQFNIKINGQHIILNHYPFLCYSGTYNKDNYSWQLFGHVHTSPYNNDGLDYKRLELLFPTQYDVGVDNNEFKPISFDEVKIKINNQIFNEEINKIKDNIEHNTNNFRHGKITIEELTNDNDKLKEQLNSLKNKILQHDKH